MIFKFFNLQIKLITITTKTYLIFKIKIIKKIILKKKYYNINKLINSIFNKTKILFKTNTTNKKLIIIIVNKYIINNLVLIKETIILLLLMKIRIYKIISKII